MAAKALFIALAMTLAPAAAPAPTSAGASTDDGGTIVSGKQKAGDPTHLVYGDDEISGEVLSPNGVRVGGRITLKHENMIGIRGVFTAEMIRLSYDM